MNRPWDIWWDFRWEKQNLKCVIIQTDHPKYKHKDYIRIFDIEDCLDENGYIDLWVQNWFNKFRDGILAGRVSLHEIMKEVN
jgi:hypothetical protein